MVEMIPVFSEVTEVGEALETLKEVCWQPDEVSGSSPL